MVYSFVSASTQTFTELPKYPSNLFTICLYTTNLSLTLSIVYTCWFKSVKSFQSLIRQNITVPHFRWNPYLGILTLAFICFTAVITNRGFDVYEQLGNSAQERDQSLYYILVQIYLRNGSQPAQGGVRLEEWERILAYLLTSLVIYITFVIVFFSLLTLCGALAIHEICWRILKELEEAKGGSNAENDSEHALKLLVGYKDGVIGDWNTILNGMVPIYVFFGYARFVTEFGQLTGNASSWRKAAVYIDLGLTWCILFACAAASRKVTRLKAKNE